MINLGIHVDLHDVLADLWNDSVETGGNSRFCYKLNCWLERCPYEDLPEYMKTEYKRGRILTYPLFPAFCYEEMGYDRKETLAQLKPKEPKKQSWWKKLFASKE